MLAELKADTMKCKSFIEGSLAMCTALVPEIGYDKAAEIAYEAYNSNKTVREVAKEKKLMSDEKLNCLLNIKEMIKSK